MVEAPGELSLPEFFQSQKERLTEFLALGPDGEPVAAQPTPPTPPSPPPAILKPLMVLVWAGISTAVVLGLDLGQDFMAAGLAILGCAVMVGAGYAGLIVLMPLMSLISLRDSSPGNDTYRQHLLGFLKERGWEVTFRPSWGLSQRACRLSQIHDNYPTPFLTTSKLLMVENRYRPQFTAISYGRGSTGIGRFSWIQFDGIFGLSMLEPQPGRLVIFRDASLLPPHSSAMYGAADSNPFHLHAQKKKWARIVTGNPAFDEAYEVYTPTPERVETFLSEDRQKRILDLRKAFGSFSFSIKENALHFACQGVNTLFDPLAPEPFTFGALAHHFHHLELAFQIPEALGIWRKGTRFDDWAEVWKDTSEWNKGKSEN